MKDKYVFNIIMIWGWFEQDKNKKIWLIYRWFWWWRKKWRKIKIKWWSWRDRCWGMICHWRLQLSNWHCNLYNGMGTRSSWICTGWWVWEVVCSSTLTSPQLIFLFLLSILGDQCTSHDTNCLDCVDAWTSSTNST